MQKKKINPTRFIQDLRSGLGPEELKKAHRLTDRGFDQLVILLQSRGLLTGEDLGRIDPKPRADKDPEQRSNLGPNAYLFICLWALGILALTLLAGYWLVGVIENEKKEAQDRHKARITWGVAEKGRTAPEMTPPPGHENDRPKLVRTGIYIDRIIEVKMPDSSWSVDFYIWFNWTDDQINPGETFQVVEGEIQAKEELENRATDKGFYQMYRVNAVITKHFNTSRFPCDDHLMTIRIEDRVKQSYQLKFVADKKGSTVSSRVKIPGYEIYDTSIIVKPHSYKTARGNPNLPPSFKATYSQFVYGLWIQRPDLGFFFKLFQGTFAAVAIALVAFFIKPTSLDPRFGLSVGAFFAAVANNYVSSSLLPDTGIMTLADMINAIGMVAIFLTITQSAISLYIFDRIGNHKLSMVFDRVSFFVFLIAYTGINIAAPMAALN
jgi:hypothetical protein